MKKKKLRIEDTLAASKAAVNEGIVTGGGTVSIYALKKINEFSNNLDGDEKTGAKIVLKHLESQSDKLHSM